MNGKSLLMNGDAATLSFHATKLFHMLREEPLFSVIRRILKSKANNKFGIMGPDRIEELGVNAKMSELSDYGLVRLR